MKGAALYLLFIWIALYGLTFTASKAVFSSPGSVSVAMGIYLGFFLMWLVHSGQGRSIGLSLPSKHEKSEPLVLLSLLILPAYNLLFCARPEPSFVALLACAAVVEEIFFRGFLLRFFRKWGTRQGIILSSTAFALFHGLNLFTGSAPAYTALQIVCAAGSGLCYGAASVICKSILPGMLAHILTNITSNGASTVSLSLFLCAAACLLWGIWLLRKKI